MICKNCGKELPDDVSFCLGCGARIEITEINVQTNNTEEDIQHCKNCGAELKRDALFCNKCGQKYDTELFDSNVVNDQSSENPDASVDENDSLIKKSTKMQIYDILSNIVPLILTLLLVHHCYNIFDFDFDWDFDEIGLFIECFIYSSSVLSLPLWFAEKIIKEIFNKTKPMESLSDIVMMIVGNIGIIIVSYIAMFVSYGLLFIMAYGIVFSVAFYIVKAIEKVVKD